MSLTAHLLLYAFYLLLFTVTILRRPFYKTETTHKGQLVYLFLFKVAAGILLTLIYTYYYTDQQKADIYRYFNDSRIISPLLFSNPAHWLKIMSGIGINDPETFNFLKDTQYFSHPGSDLVTNNTFIIRVNVLLNYFSFTNIYINTLFLNLISFTALTALYKVLRPYFQPLQQVLYLPLFLIPSVVFWNSGLLKESLLFTGISVYLYALLNSGLAKGIRFTFMALGLFILALTKLQVAVSALLFFSVFLLFRLRAPAPYIRLAGLLVVLGIVGYVASDKIATTLLDKRNEFTELALKESAGSYFETETIEPTFANLIKLLPEAFTNSILRPFVWDGGKLLQKVFALENLLFLLLLLLPLRYFKKPEGEKLLLCLAFLLFALFNYMAIGITVPIMGAIVHYRVIAAPFLMLAVLLAVDLEKLKNLLTYKRN